jgi:hypothetical protein
MLRNVLTVFPRLTRLQPFPRNPSHFGSSQNPYFATQTLSTGPGYPLRRIHVDMAESEGLILHPRKRVSQACVPCSRRKTKVILSQDNPYHARVDVLTLLFSVMEGSRLADSVSREASRTAFIRFQRGTRGVYLGFVAPPQINWSICAEPSTRERRTTSSLQDSSPGLAHGSSPRVRTPASGYELESNRANTSRFQAHETFEISGTYSPAPLGIRPSRVVPTRTAPTALPDVPRDISARLFKSYFDTIHPTWPILYKPVYDMLDHQRLLDTIPQQLLYAIYSIAACVQPLEDSAKPRVPDSTLPPPSLLFQAALLALGNDHTGDGFHPLKFLKPSLESCQALTILALQQHGVAESESAALLCSLASGMAIELRLHREMKPSSASIDSQVRSRLWWNIYVLDKMISSELARPVLLREEDTDTPYPSALESDEYQLLSLSTSSQSGPVSVKTHTISGFHTTIQFSKIVEKVLREIYSVAGRTVVRENSHAAEEARMRLWQELKEFHRMLDSSPLKLDLSSPAPAPPVTITNMVVSPYTTKLSSISRLITVVDVVHHHLSPQAVRSTSRERQRPH